MTPSTNNQLTCYDLGVTSGKLCCSPIPNKFVGRTYEKLRCQLFLGNEDSNPLPGSYIVWFSARVIKWEMLGSTVTLWRCPRTAISCRKQLPCFPMVLLNVSCPPLHDTPWKFNSSPLKNGGWKTILSYWGLVTLQGRTVKLREGIITSKWGFGRSFSFLNGWFVGSMLIFQGVHDMITSKCSTFCWKKPSAKAFVEVLITKASSVISLGSFFAKIRMSHIFLRTWLEQI